MQRSIAAKYAARPVARFVSSTGHDRERRLGLRSGLSFQPASTRLTVLRVSRQGLQVSGWQPVLAPAAPHRSGLIRPTVTMTWAGAAGPRSLRRSSPAPAPWRG